MAHLEGLPGKSLQVSTQDAILAQVEVVSDFLRDPQRRFIPEPTSIVVTFAMPNAPNAGANLARQCRVEYGSGGLQNVLGPINVYPGLTLTVHGSWVRVVALGAAGATPAEIGAFLSIGEGVGPAETVLFQRSIVAGETRQITFDGRSAAPLVVANALTPVYVPGLCAIRVSGTNNPGAFPPIDTGPSFTVRIGDAVNSVIVETYDITPGGTDVWHDIAQIVDPNFNLNQIWVTNNSPNTAIVVLHGRWNA